MTDAPLTLRIPGTPLAAEVGTRLVPEGFDLLQAEVVAAYALEASRAAAAEYVERPLAEDEFVALELEGDVVLYLTPESWREVMGEAAARGAEDGRYTVPVRLPLGSAERGLLGDFFVKALRFLRILPASEAVAELAVRDLTARLEGQLVAGPGLYQCGLDALTLTPPGNIPTDRPVLLFIHGTASSTEGSFGDLWQGEQQAAWRQHVEAAYGEHVYAFEHRTLSESPIDNALALADKLPEGARLHLVTHSRGGLVGELLCRGDLPEGESPFRAEELAPFAAERPDQAEELRRLAALLQRKRLRVERFVRVACPARGTTLASRRLDIYFSVLLNALKLIPVLRASPVYHFVESVLLAVLRRRTDPAELPGLEAMMPESPFIRLVNSRLTTSRADLAVIAGDIEAAGLFQTLAVLVTDLFYLARHDLVVNTASMSGGAPRTDGVRQSFHQGPEVSHFRYFANADSVQRLIAGLSRPDGADAGFQPLLESTRAAPAVAARAVARRRGAGGPVCFVLPGVFGSYLSVGGDLIWIDPFSLALGGMARLAVDREADTEGLHGPTYRELVDMLADSHTVVPFAYDWRQSLAHSADRLAAAIKRRLQDDPRATIRLVAHSMGGLVARLFVARHPALWAEMGKRDGSHLLMLGTPQRGAWSVPALLLGRERLSLILAALDLRHDHATLIGQLARYPGLLEMLPEDGQPDLFRPAAWDGLPLPRDWPRPAGNDLDNARRTRDALATAGIDPQRMFIVLGQDWATPDGLTVIDGELRLTRTSAGDGRVTWDAARLPGVATWYARASHGDLPRADRADHHQALLEILTTGYTNRLADTPPSPPEARPPRGAPSLDLYPDVDDLAAAAFLTTRAPAAPAPKTTPLAVSVTHGDLRYARHPVVVGHYLNDVIVSAEGVLDRRLGGRLSRSRELGIYPGAPDTAAVFLEGRADQDQPLFGALVIGLGALGGLSAAGLQAAMRRGVLEYLRHLHEGGCDPARRVGLSCLLVGTGSGGIAMEDALSALLRGAQAANDTLAGQADFLPLRLREIEFVELYLDRAVQAAKTLRSLAHNPEFRDTMQLAAGIRRARGGRERIVWSEGDDWWQRLQIRQGDGDALDFVFLTHRARAEARLVPTQRRLIDRFIERAIATTRNEARIATTLFELLVPNEFKEQAPQRDDLLLILDRHAARYPWELLQQRGGAQGERPLVVQAGLIRQLVVTRFRRHPAPPDLRQALVIGDPVSDFSELPGAQREAAAVSGLLQKQGFDTGHSLIRDRAERIIAALYAEPYRILHLAGHGVFQYTDRESGETVSGMVLGDGMYLTAAEIAQMPTLPDLVFINCCHLARDADPEAGFETGLQPNRLAASIATQLIREGARCVIAAGWAVDDRAAQRFAEVFYHRLVADNAPFGRAVLDARRATWRDYPDSNTWGAYQCYGDPNFRLDPGRASRGTTRRGPDFIIPRELTLHLHDLRERASSAASEDLTALRDELGRLLRQMPPDWHGDSALLAAAAGAWGELGEYAAAERYYRLALATDQQELPLRALEDFANVLVRGVEGRWQASGGLTPADDRRLAEAIDHLEKLVALSPTPERYALLGSAWKRRALMADSARRRSAAIDQVIHWYRAAHQLHLDRHGQPDPYPLLNWLLAATVKNWRGRRDTLGEVWTWLDEVDALLDRRCREQPDFWCRVAQIESRFARYLARDSLAPDGGHALADHLDELSARYLDACRRYGSPRQHRSVIDTLRFLLAMTEDRRTRSARTARRNLRLLIERWQGVEDLMAEGGDG